MNTARIITIFILIASFAIVSGCKPDDINITSLYVPVADTTPPTVLSTSPTSSATGIGTGTTISATFSETMDASSIVADSTFIVMTVPGGTHVAGAVIVSGTTAVFTPTLALAGNTQYQALITSGVRDLSGNAMATSYQWVFTTSAAADTTAPTVTAPTPTNGSTNVSVNTPIQAVFSEALNPATVNASTFLVNDSGGSVSGTPSYAGGVASFTPATTPLASNMTYTVTLTTGITDAAPIPNSLSANYIWSFTTAPAPNITTTTLPDGSETAPYSQTLAKTGGLPVYTWSVSVGPLPSGLALDPSTGVLSGTVTAAAGSYPFTVQLEDGDGLLDTQAFTLTIVAGPTIGTTTLPDATATQSYSRTLSAAGGTPAYNWTASAGKPAWLNLNPSTGVLSGTAVAGSYSFDVTVTDSVSATDTQALTLTVNAAPAITTTSLNVGTATGAYSQTLTATGGTGAMTWSQNGLPAGMTFNTTTGALGGTTPAAGTYNIGFAVRDANLISSATTTLTLSVNAAPTVDDIVSLPTGTVSVTYGPVQITATGGTLPYDSWSASADLAASGLSFDVVTGIISGAPTSAGTYTVGFTVTDANLVTSPTTTLSLTVN